jgi:hypothetical protein
LSKLATPYLWLPKVVRSEVEAERPGSYVLGNDQDGFEVGYVGRSDTCLRSRLLTHNRLYEFEYFLFRYASTPLDAFYQECEFWHACHDHNLTNAIHPAAPQGSRIGCPYCDFGNAMARMFCG